MKKNLSSSCSKELIVYLPETQQKLLLQRKQHYYFNNSKSSSSSSSSNDLSYHRCCIEKTKNKQQCYKQQHNQQQQQQQHLDFVDKNIIILPSNCCPKIYVTKRFQVNCRRSMPLRSLVLLLSYPLLVLLLSNLLLLLFGGNSSNVGSIVMVHGQPAIPPAILNRPSERPPNFGFLPCSICDADMLMRNPTNTIPVGTVDFITEDIVCIRLEQQSQNAEFSPTQCGDIRSSEIPNICGCAIPPTRPPVTRAPIMDSNVPTIPSTTGTSIFPQTVSPTRSNTMTTLAPGVTTIPTPNLTPNATISPTVSFAPTSTFIPTVTPNPSSSSVPGSSRTLTPTIPSSVEISSVPFTSIPSSPVGPRSFPPVSTIPTTPNTSLSPESQPNTSIPTSSPLAMPGPSTPSVPAPPQIYAVQGLVAITLQPATTEMSESVTKSYNEELSLFFGQQFESHPSPVFAIEANTTKQSLIMLRRQRLLQGASNSSNNADNGLQTLVSVTGLVNAGSDRIGTSLNNDLAQMVADNSDSFLETLRSTADPDSASFFNSVTSIESTDPSVITPTSVPLPGSPSAAAPSPEVQARSGISNNAIAGIVVVIFAALAGIVGFSYYNSRKKKSNTTGADGRMGLDNSSHRIPAYGAQSTTSSGAGGGQNVAMPAHSNGRVSALKQTQPGVGGGGGRQPSLSSNDSDSDSDDRNNTKPTNTSAYNSTSQSKPDVSVFAKKPSSTQVRPSMEPDIDTSSPTDPTTSVFAKKTPNVSSYDAPAPSSSFKPPPQKIPTSSASTPYSTQAFNNNTIAAPSTDPKSQSTNGAAAAAGAGAVGAAALFAKRPEQQQKEQNAAPETKFSANPSSRPNTSFPASDPVVPQGTSAVPSGNASYADRSGDNRSVGQSTVSYNYNANDDNSLIEQQTYADGMSYAYSLDAGNMDGGATFAGGGTIAGASAYGGGRQAASISGGGGGGGGGDSAIGGGIGGGGSTYSGAGTNAGGTQSGDDMSSHAMSSLRQNMVSRTVIAPPGKLGIVIDTTLEGPVVHKVNPQSPLEGSLFPGDIIVAIDDVDTRAMSASAITALMVRTANLRRKLTVLSEDITN